jgi:hypothetical protein
MDRPELLQVSEVRTKKKASTVTGEVLNFGGADPCFSQGRCSGSMTAALRDSSSAVY